MKISELIEQLERHKNLYGNVGVYIARVEEKLQVGYVEIEGMDIVLDTKRHTFDTIYDEYTD